MDIFPASGPRLRLRLDPRRPSIAGTRLLPHATRGYLVPRGKNVYSGCSRPKLTGLRKRTAPAAQPKGPSADQGTQSIFDGILSTNASDYDSERVSDKRSVEARLTRGRSRRQSVVAIGSAVVCLPCAARHLALRWPVFLVADALVCPPRSALPTDHHLDAGALVLTALLLAPIRRWWIYYSGLCLGVLASSSANPRRR